MSDYKGNSDASKKEKDKIVPITTNVAVRKESEFKKFKKIFFAEDSKTVKNQVFLNVIVPGIQRLFREMIITAVDVLIYGGRSKDYRDGRDRTQYSSIYDRSSYRYANERREIPAAAYNSNVFSFDEVTLFDRGETEEVLQSLKDQIERYGMVSVADFFDTIGRSAPHTANRFGWRDLRDVGIIRVKDGFAIDFPKAVPLD